MIDGGGGIAPAECQPPAKLRSRRVAVISCIGTEERLRGRGVAAVERDPRPGDASVGAPSDQARRVLRRPGPAGPAAAGIRRARAATDGRRDPPRAPVPGRRPGLPDRWARAGRASRPPDPETRNSSPRRARDSAASRSDRPCCAYNQMRRRRASIDFGFRTKAPLQLGLRGTKMMALHLQLPSTRGDRGRLRTACRHIGAIERGERLGDLAAIARGLRAKQSLGNRQPPDSGQPRSAASASAGRPAAASACARYARS